MYIGQDSRSLWAAFLFRIGINCSETFGISFYVDIYLLHQINNKTKS